MRAVYATPEVVALVRKDHLTDAADLLARRVAELREALTLLTNAATAMCDTVSQAEEYHPGSDDVTTEWTIPAVDTEAMLIIAARTLGYIGATFPVNSYAESLTTETWMKLRSIR